MIVSRSKSFILIGLLSISFFSALLVPVNAWQSALCSIHILGMSDYISCSNIHDSFTFAQGSNISLTLDNSTNTITISAIDPQNNQPIGRTLLDSGEVDGYGITLKDHHPGNIYLISFKADYSSTTTTPQSISLYINYIPHDTSTIIIPANYTTSISLQHRILVDTLADYTVTISSASGIMANGKIIWSLYG